jgi:hypothetical protein
LIEDVVEDFSAVELVISFLVLVAAVDVSP